MIYDDFISSISSKEPPAGLSSALLALWYDGKNEWEMAHEKAQDIHSSNGSWIHAYLHRKEGDIANAAYWYGKAGKPMPVVSLREEWGAIVRAICSSEG